MKHGIEPPEVETLEELGTELGKLRYDALITVLTALTGELIRQSMLDAEKGRSKLSVLGSTTAEHLIDALKGIDRMLVLSVPHMRDDIGERPLFGSKEKKF